MVTKEVLEGRLRLEVSLDDVILFGSTGWYCLPNSSASFVSRVLPLSGFPILGVSVVDA